MTDFLASLGRQLMRYRLDGAGTLQPDGAADLESPIHYVWPHPRRPLLYVAMSGRWHTPRDEGHLLRVVGLPEGGGAPRPVGDAVALPSRPIHMTLDREGRHVLLLFNAPAGIQVRAIAADGTLGPEVAQRTLPDVGIFPHQVLVSPDNAWVLVVARGHDPKGGKPEEPGSLRRFAFEGGQLRLEQVVAPQGGYGFGPRHAEFHPSLPVLYVALERQNRLQVFGYGPQGIEPDPRQDLDTLDPDGRPLYRQIVGTLHVDPAGGVVYVANRDDPHEPASHATGDNSMAAFRLDPRTGAAAVPPVHSAMDAYHVRTFSIAPPYLVGASQQDVTLPGPGGERVVPASLTVFRSSDDGRLVPVHRTEVPTGERMLFWCGFPAAYGADWDRPAQA